MLFSAQQAADIVASNSKVSADGPINTHSDVETTTPNVGDILVWNGSVWTNTENDTGITSQQIADITTNNAKISADGSINTHSDVETTTPNAGDTLSWDGINWVNIPSSVGITAEQAADIAVNSEKISADGPINTHSDVQTINVSNGQILSWNGSNWTNNDAPAGITAQQAADIVTNNAKISADGPINTHSDVEVTTPMVGDVLSWNGLNWTNVP